MQTEPTYSVAELTAEVGRVIDRAFSTEIWVQGEIRDLNRAASGHVYFSLVDAEQDPGTPAAAMVPVTLFASDKVAINRVLTRSGAGRFDDGIAVRIRGRLSHYAARGTVQLRMLWIDTDYTLGRLAAERSRVLKALADDNLLERNRSLPFPLVPLVISLVTSAGSAAHADFIEELAASGIGFAVTVFDTRVQGLEAEASLVAAIQAAGEAEVIAIVRGGGSQTDLAAFDREAVARAVALSPVPVLVGIGHEIDDTVVDRVAARSYRTPTACAAGIVADVTSFLRRLDAAAVSVSTSTHRRLTRADRDLEAAGQRLSRSVEQRMRGAATLLAAASRRIPFGVDRRLRRSGAAVETLGLRIASKAGHGNDRGESAVRLASTRLSAAVNIVERAEARVRTLVATIDGLDPARVLARGWTLTIDASGAFVRHPGALSVGDPVITIFADGRVGSTIDSVELGETFHHRQPLSATEGDAQ